jgi:hypothetical protein
MLHVVQYQKSLAIDTHPSLSNHESQLQVHPMAWVSLLCSAHAIVVVASLVMNYMLSPATTSKELLHQQFISYNRQ